MSTFNYQRYTRYLEYTLRFLYNAQYFVLRLPELHD